MATRLKLVLTGKRQQFFEPLRMRIALGDHESKGGDHYLSARCASIAEFQAEVQALKSQLDKLLYKAKARFAGKRKPK